MKFHSQDNLAKVVRKFGNVFVLVASAHVQFNFHMKRADRGSSRRSETRMQEIVMFIQRPKRGEQHKTSTEVGSSSRSVVNRRSPEFMEENYGSLQPIRSVCLD